MGTEKERTVIHLEKDGKHYYYGSIARMYEDFTVFDLDISYGSLRNYGLTPDNPYKNKRCIIRKGILKQKSGGRGIKKSNKIIDLTPDDIDDVFNNEIREL